MGTRETGTAGKGNRRNDAAQPGIRPDAAGEIGLGNAGRSSETQPAERGPATAELVATVDGQPVASLFCLFRDAQFLITHEGTHEIAKLFYWAPPGDKPKFAINILDGFNRIGPESVQRADLDTSKGLLITTGKYRVLIPFSACRVTWKP